MAKTTTYCIQEWGAEKKETSTDEADTPHKLGSDFRNAPYWNNRTIAAEAECYMLSVSATYSNIDGFRSTPQYSSTGLKEFRKEGYDVTVSKLNDNLNGINTVEMLDKKQIIKDVCYSALSYLMFLKRKRKGIVKAKE